MRDMHEWTVVSGAGDLVRTFSVPGGWLYVIEVVDASQDSGYQPPSTTFVPHPPMIQVLPDGTMAVVAPPIVVEVTP